MVLFVDGGGVSSCFGFLTPPRPSSSEGRDDNGGLERDTCSREDDSIGQALFRDVVEEAVGGMDGTGGRGAAGSDMDPDSPWNASMIIVEMAAFEGGSAGSGRGLAL